MIKKSILFLVIGLYISCGSKRTVIATSKPKEVVRTVKKPIQKSLEEKPTIVDKQEQTNQTIEILEATTRVKVTTEIVLQYIEKYKNIAKEDMVQYKIPASITLGQGILESGAGTGPLSAQANNHFGIKCHKEWNGPTVKHDDDEAQECFRKYSNPNESYRDHSLFLTSRERYSPLFKLEKNDYKAWARGLKAAGYATDREYANKLIGLIERYQLQQYDAEVLGTNYVPTVVVTEQKSNNSLVSNSERHQVSKGDTLYSISKKYNITIEDLKKINNMSDTSISIGQTLQIK